MTKHFECKHIYAIGFNNVTFNFTFDVIDPSLSLPQILYASIGSIVGLIRKEEYPNETHERFVGLGLIWSVHLGK